MLFTLKISEALVRPAFILACLFTAGQVHRASRAVRSQRRRPPIWLI